ncbi:MAG: DUF3179 domain-containing protein [Candidatus Aenigmarchaeota archaeon]|nr:DUF3179 domain-containing protein [Candidatus Aenigmarchaeota archaeon]
MEKITSYSKYLYGVIIIAVVAVIVFYASRPVERAGTGFQTGELAPDFTLQTPDGRSVSLSDFRGAPVIINFWASWCPFCVDEMPLLERAAQESGARLVFINLQESRETAMNFADKLGIKSPIALDPEADAKKKYNVFTQPVTYFIDANGVIVDKKFGPLTEEELFRKIGSLKSVSSLSETKIINGEKYLASVDPSDILSGGPPKDGIPSIDKPKFELANGAAWLNSDDLVLGLSFNGVVKAYPHRILNWHEIVNDFAGDVPVAVTFCPLCRTGIVYERIISGETVEFGTSGNLFKSDLVMYDRKTETYWSQVLGQGIKGELAGMKLKAIPVDTVRWGDWKARHPGTLVLSRDTGFPQYLASGRYDIVDLYGTDRPGFSGIGVSFTDTRLPSNSIVYGVVINNEAKAYEEQAIKSAGVINDEVGGQKILVLWDKSLDTGRIYHSPGNFSIRDGALRDSSGKAWTTEELDRVLARVDSFPHFWFAWAAFYPDTGLHKSN